MFSEIWFALKVTICVIQNTLKEWAVYLFLSKKSVKGKIILITGGGKGIGRRLALALATQKPKHVILWGRDVESLKNTQSDIQAIGVEATYFKTDVSSRENIYKTAEEVQQTIGPVNLLINNAGVVCGKPLLDTTDSEFEYSLRVNTLAHIWTIKAFLPSMLESGEGHIVCMNSILGMMGLHGTADYTTTKFALTGLMQSLMVELQEYRGISLSVIHPYQVQNEMFAGMSVRFPRLFPPLSEEYVVDQIMKAIQYRTKQLILPAYFTPILFFKSVLPVSAMMYDFLYVAVSYLSQQ
ncbi:short-chain dehydrogenase/reductase 3-like isoform X2 [Dreissena polymorpha]|uniref:short-chain dehydrogenase/reductase 3-like isoform X2 n=1 Tax=Dreissena polymorpha TaxID=45954 RepID=UPI0022644350|nr:short-chain dehydrogenase/reductase 3-like isoform X2 [Dreissena polymorpha]